MTGVLKKGENIDSKRHAQKENNVKTPREKSKKASDCQQTPGAAKEKEGFPPHTHTHTPNPQRGQRDFGSVATLGLPSRTLKQ